VALEKESSTKHEFLDGEIYAMAGGTGGHRWHCQVRGVSRQRAQSDLPCRAHTSDLRLYVEPVGLATFPDATVICGPLQQHPASPEATATNPLILVEVTSDSSEEYDTGTKLEAYQTIPTLREYVLVAHRERRITVYRREANGWQMRSAIGSGRITVEALSAELVVDVIYRNSSIA
jgi:Uma2 family endonuclease